MNRLWDYCAFCGKRIETGEKCYGLPNGESVCVNCCVAENDGMVVLMDAAPYFEKAAQMLEKLPAADVAPVVHGRWEFLGPNRLIGECMCGTCSVCKVRSKYIVNTMLCPNCGAKMDGVE